jgi:hypothetical protein
MGQEIIDVPINDDSLVSTTATTHEIDNSSQDDNEDNS